MRPCSFSLNQQLRKRSTTAGRNLVLSIPRANVFRFGDSINPVIKNLDWTIHEHESWAVVGSGGKGKSVLLETLLGHTRISPSPPDGLYPFLTHSRPSRDPHECISLVSFATRRRVTGSGFYDYTARYGAVREEDRVTLRESLFSDETGTSSAKELAMLADQLDLTRLLDLPLVALSNGQTRRARIVKELLTKPEVLLLDEPLTGLDVNHRPKLTKLLGEIHASRKPRIIMALRLQDPIPDWITHVAVVHDGDVITGPRDSVKIPYFEGKEATAGNPHIPIELDRKELVSMKDVNVAYHDRHVLKDINWSIREGDRWHLQGANGSGKTTLLSILTGDHPQSYVQRHLHLFSAPRRRQPTSTLQQLIGSVSPELYNAFPRRLGPNALTVRDTIATGFESTFSYRPRTPAMNTRINDLLDVLGPAAWGGEAEGFDARLFAELPPGEQSLVLLLRALVNKPPLLILDEVFSGMDARMVEVTRKYLRERLEGKQAVVFVTHWEEEVPWGRDAVKRLKLEDGQATEL